MDVKIFSYNVHGLPYIAESWTQPLAEWFSGTDYDFICLQEVFTEGRLRFLTEALNTNGYLVLKPNDAAKMLSSGLLTAIRRDRWTLQSDTFYSYDTSIGIEKFANKGFHCLHVINRATGNEMQFLNTHLQADNSFNYITSLFKDFNKIRERQCQQMIDVIKGSAMQCIIIGDINSEISPHKDIIYLTGSINGLKKHTFTSSGEDIDHVAYVGGRAPRVTEITILHSLLCSDHQALHVRLLLERSPKQ
jgi:exonuclease III